jgi:pimeloyl-ACP methyl ester carboxylesterase
VLLFLTHAAYAESIRDYVMGREDGSTIHYYLLQPSTESASDTLLLILQGSDCNSVLQVEAIFSDYRNVWPEADVLLVEKYGIDKTLNFSADVERSDCPSQYLKNDSPQQRVADIEAVLAGVRQRGRYPNLIVLGGSEGAAVANMVAAKVDEVSATVAFNGGGRWFIDDVIHSISASAEDSASVEEAVNGFRGFSRHILNSPPSDLVVSGHGYKWWHEMLSLDQRKLLEAVDTPLLIVRYRLRRWMS